MMDIIKDCAGKFSQILGSASKLVLLIFAGTVCAALFTGHIDSQIFNAALMMVLGFYFGKTSVSGTDSSK